MKKKMFLSLIFFGFFTTIIKAQNCIKNEGVYEIRNNWGLEDGSFKTNKIWIKDNLTIHEEKGYFSYDSSGINIYKGYEVYKYVFTDLSTKKRQDYYFFSDTATIGCNYNVSDSCFAVPQIASQNKYCAIDSLVKIKDTVIDHEIYKRIKYIERHEEYNYRFEYIYYLSKHTSKNKILFKNCNVIEQLYPGYTVERIDFYSPSPHPHTFISEIKVIRNTLTEAERRVFAQWENNIAKVNLPIISCQAN